MATIETRKGKDGTTYRVRVRVRGQQRTATFERKTDAKTWAAEVESKLKLGKRVASSQAMRRTLGELIDFYLTEYLPDKTRNRDQANYRRHLTYWKDNLGTLPLIDVTAEAITRQRNKLAKGDTVRGARRSPGTVNRYLISLSHCFTVGIKTLEWIDANPVRIVEKLEEPQGRVRFLSPDEIAALLKQAKASACAALYPVVILALSTGMRSAEIMGLRWGEVDLDRQQITLPKERTKTRTGRMIPLVGHALETLRDWAKVRRIDTDLVFPGRKKGRPLVMRLPWEAALKAAGIENYRFHDNRHSAASYLLMTGATDLEIAGILGHATLSMVKRYAHLSDQHRRGVLERMNTEVFK